MVTPLKTLMGFSVHLNVQLKFYNLPLFSCFSFCFTLFLIHTASPSANLIIMTRKILNCLLQ
ncbi:hypothetical protein EAI26_06485 [Lactobacillus sp. 0.1XD8-4]|nr:hypothetical protein [Lactobacillus sp. 0.1XD8-4]